MDVTIIVPTKNESANIVPFLQSIPPDIKVVIVDSSTDNTPQLIAEHRPNKTTVIRQKANIPEARQIGAEFAQTAWLLFTDADVSFAPDYFERLQQHLDRGGSIYSVIYGSKLSKDRFQTYYRWFTLGQKLVHAIGLPGASGSNLLIQKVALQAVHGFDLKLSCNEDSEIVWRIKQAGYPIVFAPELTVFARDHRRLEQGILRKTLHQSTRCLLIYFNLLPSSLREDDWGYWNPPKSEKRKKLFSLFK